MSGQENRRAFPPDIQAVFVMAEEGDSCAVCIELEALIQTRHSLGAAGRGMSPLDVALEYLRLRTDETGVKLKRVVATGIAVKLSCAA